MFALKKTIYFTGFMASGKSRIGRSIAERLHATFIDTDALIVERQGKSISEIFEEQGEAAFRKMELETIQEIAADSSPKVVALGGGTLTQAAVVSLIRKTGIIVRLWASPEVLSERIGRKDTRPLMSGLSPEERLEKVKTMLAEREERYALADFSVESTNDSEDIVISAVLRGLKFWDSRAVYVEPSGGSHYPIFIGHKLIPQISSMLAGLRLAPKDSFLVCTDTTIAKAQSRNLGMLRHEAGNCPAFKFRAGEIYKNLSSLNQLYTFMLRRRYSRKSCLLQLSGGVVGDMAGFAAATYQRGIDFVQIPTTLLSMVDSSVGGKVAVNHSEGKNMIGAFYQPKAVVCDLDVLATLPDSEYLAGLAEVVKYGVIYDEKFFAFLEQNVQKILARDSEALAHIIRRSCEIKAEVVGIDEKEQGLRAILNYGHTFGHAIENLHHYEFSHGIGVSLGMRVAARLARNLGMISPEIENRQTALLDAYGFPKTVDGVQPDAAWDAMGVDKKVEKNKRVYILPTKIGEVKKVANVEESLVKEAWKAVLPEVTA
ncbi:MAG: 3-dehydroquinate synthase [Hallerella porci]|uniref:Multifunctional fusion protein n=1 Tax=Hallerella porci TaxID=1945871 RepID=A0ABX5LL51_9BACT|nr:MULTISPECIES: 3-dehydroquinate synthase [Hallerella]MCI5600196.1 3-dehydroquinate synthase [Hallerella sp.]MDY3920884.1 3-dehydroquinate synthase [Hallerella porci]PWK92227.1 3-dehydroquinate synthase [Hallerella porci]